MENQRLDILEVLDGQLAHHKEQVQRVQLAISAVKDCVATNRKYQRLFRWSSGIDDIFAKEKEPLSVYEIKNRLVERGLPAHGKEYIATIQNTLLRRTGITIERVANGIYKSIS